MRACQDFDREEIFEFGKIEYLIAPTPSAPMNFRREMTKEDQQLESEIVYFTCHDSHLKKSLLLLWAFGFA
jgi:hypothetical protein